MAGGLLIVLGLQGTPPVCERGIGSGIHGGDIFIRGSVDDAILGVGAKQKPASDEERHMIAPVIRDFAAQFSVDPAPLLSSDYTRIVPASARPFANKYTWE
jgi:glutamate synthase domain-containing protein 3